MTDWKTFDGWEDDGNLEPFELEGATVTMTCWACPEQYDVHIGDTRIGYMRLRWGRFYAAYPDCGGETVYERQLNNSIQGSFSPEERQKHLPLAIKALKERHAHEQST